MNQGLVAFTEVYNVNLRHYFYTQPCNKDELGAVLSGSAGQGWQTTGRQYVMPVKFGYPTMCRFYGSLVPGPNSHLYVYGAECAEIKRLEKTLPSNVPRWNYEEEPVPIQAVPAAFDGQCPTPEFFSRPIVRMYNNGAKLGKDSNHRFLPIIATDEIASMVGQGWVNEGIIFCARASYKDGLLEQ